MENKTIEKELFDWGIWDMVDDMVISFEKVTLNKDIGKFKKFTEFESAVIDYQKSELIFYKDNEEFKFNIELKVIENEKIE